MRRDGGIAPCCCAKCRQRRAAARRVVGAADGIGCAPFGSKIAERIVRPEDRVAECVGGGDAVAEEVVGVGFGDGAGSVGVGVHGEEVAGGGVGEGLGGRDRRVPPDLT